MPVRLLDILGRSTVASAALLAAGPLLAAQSLVAQEVTDHDVRSLGPGRVVAQVGTGLILGPIGYVGGGLATRYVVRRLGGSPGAASTAAERAAYVGTAAATAAGPAFIGARGPGHGNYFAALGGATVGMFGSALVARLNRTPDDRPLPPCRLACRLSGAAALLLPSVGATVGYNLSRRR